MKKIYLLLLLSLLSIKGFSTRFYSIKSGDMTQDSVWCVFPSAILGCVNPTLPGMVADTWIVQTPLFLPPGGKFHVNGSLMFWYGLSVLRMGTQADTMAIGQNLIFPSVASGGPGLITSVAGAGALLLTVGNNLFMDDNTFITDSSSRGTTIDINGDLYMGGTSYISSDSIGTVSIFFTGRRNPQNISWTSTGVCKYGRLEIDAPDTVALQSYVPLPDSPAAAGNIVNGELICNVFGFFGNGDGSQPFHINDGASIYTANTGGMDSSIKYCVDTFSKIANYIFDGFSPQVTGITLPDSIYSSGSVTINNPLGVTLSKALHFGDDPIVGPAVPSLNLELGVFTIGVADSILSMNEADVNVDTGTFSSAPTYAPAGVVVTYESLGYNALAVTTGYELLPTLPLGIAVTNVNKSNATITLGSSFTTGSLSINAGVLDASISNYNITLSNFGASAAQWSNNASPAAFTPQSGTVTITRNMTESIFTGTFPTTFFNLTLNDKAGAELAVDETVNGTLTLDNGKLNTEGNALVLGPSATPVAGTFSDTSMIVMWYLGSSEVQKYFTADGSYFFPIGDTANYSPITLNFSGSGAYTLPAAAAAVTVHNVKDPHNTDTNNYINRYWQVAISNIVAPSYSVTATYVPGDVVGTEGDIAMGEYNGTLPWTKYGVTDVATHTLTSGIVTDGTADFTGLDSAGPGVTVSDDTTICIGGFDTLQVVSVVGDTPFVYTWAPAAGLSATTGTVVVASPTVTTTYTCTVTDANGTSGTDTVMITVNPAPTIINATNNGPICSDSTLILVANGSLNVTGYAWQGPAVLTASSTGDTASLTGALPTATGIYTVTVSNGIGSGCTAVYYDTAVVDTLPDTTVVTGGGTYCDSNTIFAFNPGADIVYYEDTNSGGTSTDFPATSMLITNPGTHTYYFRAQSTLGCWGAQGSATVTINSLPLPDTAHGGGTFCDSTVISASNGDSGTIYFQGTVSGGTSTTMGGTPQTVTASGIYYFRARSAAGCWGQEASDTVIINPTPAPVTASGAGTFCGADTISASGGAGGTIYYQFDTSLGMDSLLGGTPQVVDSSGTYFFRSEAAGCWSKQDSVIVVINPLPATVIISTNGGATTFCDSTTIFASNGGDGIIYYEDTNTNSFSTAMAEASAFLDSENTSYAYHFRAQNPATGCWSKDTSVAITINALPDTVTATGGGGPFCGSTVITGFNGVDPTINIYFEGNAPGGTSTVFGFPDTLHYTVDTSGTYYFRAQNSVTGCWSREGVSTDSVTVLINPLPPVHNVTGGGSMCAGGSGFHLGLDGSDTGIKYQLYNDTTLVGPVLLGTGAPLDFGVFTAGATYYVIAINTTTGCNDTTATSALINVNPLPNVYSISSVSGGAYCFGGTGVDISLTNADFNVTYMIYVDGVLDTSELSTGDPDLGANFTDTGTYTIVAVTDSGCTDSMLGSAVISTYPLPTVYTVSGGGTLCSGDTGYHVFLSGSQLGLQYQLINSGVPGASLIGTGHSLDFGLQTAAGVYTVVASNLTTTCVNNMAGSATVFVNPLPTDETVIGGGSYCAGTGGLSVGLASSDGDSISYQLFYDLTTGIGSPIIGTGGAFNFPPQTTGGTYSVVATNMNTGCVTVDPSMSVAISINPLPALYTLFGGGSYCAGGAGYNIGISGSQVGITYYLYNDGVLADSVNGTGTLDSFGHQTAAGTYTVIAKNLVTSCVSNILGSVTIAINSLPVIDTVRGGGSYCSGSAGVMIGLNGSTIGINYQLSRAGSSVGGPVAGTNSPLDFGIFLPAGTYKVTATNAVTGCVSNMADSAVVSINPLPSVYAITGGGSYCSGSPGITIGLSGSSAGVKYQLFYGTVASGSPRLPTTIGDTLIYGVFTAPGGYSVIARDTATGCTDSMAGMATISINPLPPVHLVVGGGVYCTGGAGVDVELSRSDYGYVYLLYDGTVTVGPPLNGTDTVLNFGPQTLAGTYTVYAIDTATTCADSMAGSATITVNSVFIPVISIAAHPGTDVAVGARDTLVATVTGGGPDATIQWYVNGNLVPGATNDTFAFNIYYNTDSITCQVTSHGVCGDYTASQSLFITLHNVGVTQLTGTGSDIKLMPNPNKGAFTIKGTLGTTADEEVSVEVTDMLGQVVYKDKIMAMGGNIDQQIQLSSSLANGMYILNLRSAGQDNIFHFVVEQ